MPRMIAAGLLVAFVGLAGCDSTRRLLVDSSINQHTPDSGVDAPGIDPKIDGGEIDAEPTDPTCETNDDCAADEFCRLSGACQPGGAAKPRCEKRPEGCDGLYAPVCGCDGVTYAGECDAHSVGVNVASKGECSGECGLLMHLPACPEGTMCDFASCGAATGTCVESPTQSSCLAIDGMPECGCDGNSYDNSCWRQLAGVALDHLGTCNSGGPVTVTTNNNSYDPGETVVIKLFNGMNDSIFLPGCSAIELERLEDGAWVGKGPTAICSWEGIAQEVQGGTAELFNEAVPPGTWRILVRYGLGCTPGKPLSEASCAMMQEARSAQFYVKPSEAFCKNLQDNYSAAVPAAKKCDELINTPQCTHLVGAGLPACCNTYVNTTTKLDAIKDNWTYSDCPSITPPTPCPMCTDPIGAICDSNLCYDQDV